MTQYDTLRDNGLPWLVPVRHWRHNILQRSIPALLYMTIMQLVLACGMLIIVRFPEEVEVASLVLMAVTVFALVVVPAGVWLYMKRLGAHADAHVFMHISLLLVSSIVLSLCLGDEGWLVSSVQNTVGWVIAILLLTWVGVFSLARWAFTMLREQVGVIGTIVTKILPFSLTAVIFSYFAPGIWMAAAQLSPRTLLGFVAFIAFVGLVATFATTYSSLRDYLQTEKKRVRNILPVVNVYFNIACTQLLQAAIFFGLLTFLLVIVSLYLIRDTTLAEWAKQAPEYGKLLGVTIPIATVRLKAAAIIATFSSLSFLLTVAADKTHRQTFFEPIVGKIVSLLARSRS